MAENITKKLFTGLAALIALAIICSPLMAYELAEVERNQLERDAAKFKTSGEFEKAQAVYSDLIRKTSKDNRERLTEYYFQYGYCILKSKKNPDLESAYEKFKEAWTIDENYHEAYFYGGLTRFRQYEKNNVEDFLNMAKQKMLKAQELGYDVIEKLEELTEQVKTNDKGEVEKSTIPGQDELHKLLEDPGYVIELIKAETFEFNPSEIEDPFTCPLQRKQKVDTTEGTDTRPGVYENEIQTKKLERAREILDMVRNDKTMDDEKALELWNELDKIFTDFQNKKFDGPENKELEKIYIIFTQGEQKPWYYRYQRINIRKEGNRLVNSMKRFQRQMNENNYNELFGQVSKNYAELQEYIQTWKEKYTDEQGVPLAQEDLIKIVNAADETMAKASAIKEFFELPIKITGVAYPDIGKPIALLNSERVEEGSALDD